MSEGVKNPIQGMFDADKEKEGTETEAVFDNEASGATDTSEEKVPVKNTTEKMFETNLKADDGELAGDIEQDVKESPTKALLPPKMDFRDGKLTAEERLLRVIDDNGEVDRTSKFSRLKLPNFGDITGKTADIICRMKEKWFRQSFSLAVVNKGLLVAIGFIAVISIANAFAFTPDIKTVHDRVARLESRALGSTLALHKPMEEYLRGVAKRSLFHPMASDTNKAPAGGPAIPPGGEDKVLGDLQLVGIAWGEYPEAMIRDKSDNRTYFLKKDQQFKGIKVQEVSKDKVTVEYGGKTKELM